MCLGCSSFSKVCSFVRVVSGYFSFLFSVGCARLFCGVYTVVWSFFSLFQVVQLWLGVIRFFRLYRVVKVRYFVLFYVFSIVLGYARWFFKCVCSFWIVSSCSGYNVAGLKLFLVCCGQFLGSSHFSHFFLQAQIV